MKEKERELWIILNAERQIEWEKGLTYFDKFTSSYKPTIQALNPRTMEEALEISKRQLEYDEKCGQLRFTLEQLLTLDRDQFIEIQQQRHQEWCKKLKEL